MIKLSFTVKKEQASDKARGRRKKVPGNASVKSRKSVSPDKKHASPRKQQGKRRGKSIIVASDDDFPLDLSDLEDTELREKDKTCGGLLKKKHVTPSHKSIIAAPLDVQDIFGDGLSLTMCFNIL